MRRLVKQKCPKILEQNHKAWTIEYLNIIYIDDKPTKAQSGRYRHPQIKQTLILETHGKCAYCESKLPHVYPGDIEHIKPKSLYPTEIFSWLNLTLACSVCNTNKAVYPNDTAPLIHPYDDEPQEHLTFFGPMVVHKSGSTKGQLTTQILKLNRIELIEKRKEKLQSLLPLIELWNNTQPGDVKEGYRYLILEECKLDKEFSLMVECFLSQYVGLLAK